MENEKPFFKDRVQLEKFNAKGGWTYATLPGILPDKGRPFGMRKVRGFIDDYKFSNYQLMPMGNGRLFLPVKAEIRKKIKKEAGDWVAITLYSDEEPMPGDEDFMQCLRDEPAAFKNFEALTTEEQKKFMEWIAAAKNAEQSVERIASAIDRILAGQCAPQ